MNVERDGIVVCAIQRKRGPTSSRSSLLLLALPAEMNMCVCCLSENKMPSIFYRLLLKMIVLPATVKCVSDGGCCFGQGGVSQRFGVGVCLFLLLPAHPPLRPTEWQQGKVLFNVIFGEG